MYSIFSVTKCIRTLKLLNVYLSEMLGSRCHKHFPNFVLLQFSVLMQNPHIVWLQIGLDSVFWLQQSTYLHVEHAYYQLFTVPES